MEADIFNYVFYFRWVWMKLITVFPGPLQPSLVFPKTPSCPSCAWSLMIVSFIFFSPQELYHSLGEGFHWLVEGGVFSCCWLNSLKNLYGGFPGRQVCVKAGQFIIYGCQHVHNITVLLRRWLWWVFGWLCFKDGVPFLLGESAPCYLVSP